MVVDVRRRPGSRRVPWFSRGVLEEELPRRGIGYVWLGRLLGGFRRGGYEAYMRTPSYWRGIAVLTRVILESPGPVALMCRERVWRRCHRRYIAETLACKGYEVVHIIDLGVTERHRSRSCGGSVD